MTTSSRRRHRDLRQHCCISTRTAASPLKRFPSGDKNELRGLGVTRTLAALIWSKGARSPHANVGYEFWSDNVPPPLTVGVCQNQAKYAVGVEFEAHPRPPSSSISSGGTDEWRPDRVSDVSRVLGTIADLLVCLRLGQVALAPGVKFNVWRSS
jgi:hypothetical protein